MNEQKCNTTMKVARLRFIGVIGGLGDLPRTFGLVVEFFIFVVG